MADKTMISCLAWIKRGYAKEDGITNADIQNQMAEMMDEEELIQEAKDYKSKYENEDDMTFQPNLVKESNIDNQGIQEDKLPFGFEESEEEKDEYKIKNTDNQLVVGKIEDEFASLEVYIYEKNKGNLFVHHDIMLSSFPLCLEWLPCEPSSLENTEQIKANYAIVGTFYPDIEIWNLDELDAIQPTITLAGVDKNPLQKTKKKKIRNQTVMLLRVILIRLLRCI